MTSSPFFSIGLPTYNRPELLKQCLSSILGQTFTDFEVIVGNDHIKTPLSGEQLDIDDPRVRFVNHPHNLGEIDNMNSLLALSRGRYFTWQFDDDLYAPDFLEAAHSALIKFDFPQCVYTSYRYVWGTSFPKVVSSSTWPSTLFFGRHFLRAYLSGDLKLLGCCGVFKTDCLREMGGMKKLCDHPIGAHSEHFIVIQAGLLDSIVYVKSPLVLYRNYDKSWSYRNKDADTYVQAGRIYLLESVAVLQEPALRGDFQQNLSVVIESSLDIVIGKLIARDGRLDKSQLNEYLLSINAQFASIADEGLRKSALSSLDAAIKKNRVFQILKAKFKVSAPVFLVRLAHMIRAYISRYTNRFS